ncbi:hypothetical protein EI94DRAFT_1095276 [Lactarius quietus]|nr:hypothetical protein EI94DRAFT_1095276 [Lactarius quietus]
MAERSRGAQGAYSGRSSRSYTRTKRGRGGCLGTSPCIIVAVVGSKPLPTSSMSSLFGAVSVMPRPPAAYSTSQSSLFGVPPSTIPKTKSFDRFQDVVNRIHSTPVIALTVPQVLVQETTVTTAEVETIPTSDVPIDRGSQSNNRDTIRPSIPKTNSQPRHRRRDDRSSRPTPKEAQAREEGTTADNDGDGKKETTAKAEEVVPFDFESAQNILDDGAVEEEDGKAGKRKRQKRGILGTAGTSRGAKRLEGG